VPTIRKCANDQRNTVEERLTLSPNQLITEQIKIIHSGRSPHESLYECKVAV